MGLLSELKRRNVIRVAIAYGVASWLLIEVTSVILPIYSAPDWVIKVLVALIAVGLPIVLLFSWVYELTPEGVKKESEIDRSQSVTGNTGQRLDKITIAMLLLVGMIVVFVRFSPSGPGEASVGAGQAIETSPSAQLPHTRGRSQNDSDPNQPETPSSPELSIAVLPFVNMSADADNEYFSDGVSEEILNVLSRIPDLQVAARTSAFLFKGKDLGIPEIGRQLKVAHILEGSVRKAGNQVRITAQLIKVDNGFHLWSATYTRTLDDIFAIQDEIAQAIVEALKVTLGTGTRIDYRSTTNSLAYNHYLKGRFFWHQRTTEGFAAAKRELTWATEIDPAFSDAWSALGDVYILLPEYLLEESASAIPKARYAVDRALELNPGSPQALTTRAYLRALYDWDQAGAEADFRRALELDPRYATAYQWYAEVLDGYRRPEEALVLARRAMALDPLAPIKPFTVGNVLRGLRRYDEAASYYDQALDVSPGWAPALENKAVGRLYQGRYEEARALHTQWVQSQGPGADGIDYVLATIDALDGRISRAEAVRAITTTDLHKGTNIDKAEFLAMLGAYDKAIEFIKRSIDAGDSYSIYINNWNGFEPMRELPEFQALLRRLKFEVDE